jgi:hypothetical protein
LESSQAWGFPLAPSLSGNMSPNLTWLAWLLLCHEVKVSRRRGPLSITIVHSLGKGYSVETPERWLVQRRYALWPDPRADGEVHVLHARCLCRSGFSSKFGEVASLGRKFGIRNFTLGYVNKRNTYLTLTVRTYASLDQVSEGIPLVRREIGSNESVLWKYIDRSISEAGTALLKTRVMISRGTKL